VVQVLPRSGGDDERINVEAATMQSLGAGGRGRTDGGGGGGGRGDGATMGVVTLTLL
jgi:hypothetical protein